MKKLVLSLVILAGFALQAFAYDFQSGELLYTIISTDLPKVSLNGHVDGTEAQGDIIIPETVIFEDVTYKVSAIEQFAFYHCVGITSLIIGQSVETIGRQCFEGCTGLTGNLIIPNSVIQIEDCAFYDCTSLNGKLVLSENLTDIKTSVFRNCGFTGNLVIPEGIRKIGSSAFWGCNFTGDLVIPNSVITINDLAFHNCSSFDGQLLIGSSVTTIGASAFSGCSGLTGDLVIPNSVVFVYTAAFSGCSGLTGNLTLSLNLREIGRCAFQDCSSLSGDLIIPNGVNEIGWLAFKNCIGLDGRLEIPNTIWKIESGTFQSCSFSSLLLGDYITEIHNWAFKDLSTLNTITIKAKTPPSFIETDVYGAFENVPNNIPLFVPCGTLEAYQTADGWSEFTNIHEGVTDALTVHSSDETAGTVYLLKEATCEDRTVEVLAESNEGWKFLYWEANGESVSSENPYSFVLEEDTELVAYFSGTGVDEKEQMLVVFPNPTTGVVNIIGKNSKTAEVYNGLGQHLASASGEDEQITIDLDDLPVGIYFVNIFEKDGRKCVRKIVKE